MARAEKGIVAVEPVSEVILERFQVFASRVLYMDDLARVEPDQVLHLAGEMGIGAGTEIVRFVASLPTEPPVEQREEVTFSYPATWWQMFKVRWFPAWLERRYPVRERTAKKDVVVRVQVVYPKLKDCPQMTRGDIRYVTHSCIEDGEEA